MKFTKCKVTNKKIPVIFNFGKMPIANGFLNKKDFKKEFFYNMGVSFSKDVSLMQLNNHPKPEMMFNENYPFFTSSSKFMKNHFKNYANWAKRKYVKTNNTRIIEIGSNDGTFLKNFKKKNFQHLGFEPSKNVSEIAKKNGILWDTI